MASSEAAQLTDIQEQELDIFEQLGGYEPENEPTYRTNLRLAKLKAKQQLALSDDSPFAHLDEQSANITDSERRQLREEKATLLRNETSQIREQLNFVKQKLHEIKSGHYQEPTSIDAAKQPTIVVAGPKRPTKDGTNSMRPETKYRPLTGKADCPNCACDTRRRSICDLCLKINSMSASSGPKVRPSEKKRCYVDYANDYDNRPIRPAKEKTLAKVEVPARPVGQAPRETVDAVVVPGRVYTISKSLNEKRTKLAQAIDELQRMMEQVKAKNNRLEEERKLVQLYKDQWKFGPSIGGPKSSSRERLGLNQEGRNYESRLDANLARDSKSVMGFKHIEPSLKLRQYNKSPNTTRRNPIKKAPPAAGKTVPVSIRSKSLESLRQEARVPPHVVINENFQNGKASSEMNLRKINEDEEKDIADDEAEVEVEEKIEEEMDVAEAENEQDVASRENEVPKQGGAMPSDGNGKGDKRVEDIPPNDGKISRMTWIPVFGETEIKTVKKPATRKVQIMKPSQQGSSFTTTVQKPQAVPLNRYQYQKTSRILSDNIKRVTISSPSIDNQPARNDRVLNEANRKLRFASDLLEQEKCDSRSKNQLLVNKRPPPAIIHNVREESNKSAQDSQAIASKQTAQVCDQEEPVRSSIELSESSRNELARIEEMVNEQQKLLNRLTQLQERQQVVCPVTVTCSSPCCMMHRRGGGPSSCGSNPSQRVPKVRLPIGRSLLVSTLKDRLNKGKLQLARTLEQEREKHQQLRHKVDSSLRKQSDLQHENELLKQSLSKCIDTCLRDISSTFESLSDTLTDSVAGIEQVASADPPEGGFVVSSTEDLASESGQVSTLSQAAQFISDNKYLRQLKAHIETIEQQRKSIFKELEKEKQKSLQLEAKLKESQSEMAHLGQAKRKLETQLKSMDVKKQLDIEPEPTPGCSRDFRPSDGQEQRGSANEAEPQSAFEARQMGEKNTSQMGIETSDQQNSSELDDSQSSIELYRKYIESMSPDIESIRRERKMILNEFDNIKKMLAVMDQ